MEVTLIDSPVANVANIARALRTVGASLHVTSDPSAIGASRKIVLPGVGSFIAAMTWLQDNAIDAALRRAVANGASLLGICVGHQLLFDVSHEMGTTRGLGLVRGEVRQFAGPLPVPQIGWNQVSLGGQASSPAAAWRSARRDDVEAGRLDAAGETPSLLRGIAPNTSFYFVNSYAAMETPHAIARADYGGSFAAAVRNGRVFGVQFHPEKSSAAGLQVLRNFVAWT